jgi:hypothetical protein
MLKPGSPTMIINTRKSNCHCQFQTLWIYRMRKKTEWDIQTGSCPSVTLHKDKVEINSVNLRSLRFWDEPVYLFRYFVLLMIMDPSGTKHFQSLNEWRLLRQTWSTSTLNLMDEHRWNICWFGHVPWNTQNEATDHFCMQCHEWTINSGGNMPTTDETWFVILEWYPFVYPTLQNTEKKNVF